MKKHDSHLKDSSVLEVATSTLEAFKYRWFPPSTDEYMYRKSKNGYISVTGLQYINF